MSRGVVAVSVAVILLATGVFALHFPVFIDAYDQYGWQIRCGTGFTTDLSQASSTGSNFVTRCNNALLIRRAWAIPAAAIGGLMLTWLATATIAHDRRRPAPRFQRSCE